MSQTLMSVATAAVNPTDATKAIDAVELEPADAADSPVAGISASAIRGWIERHSQAPVVCVPGRTRPPWRPRSSVLA